MSLLVEAMVSAIARYGGGFSYGGLSYGGEARGHGEKRLYPRLAEGVEDLFPLPVAIDIPAVVEDSQVRGDVCWGQAHRAGDLADARLSIEQYAQDANPVGIRKDGYELSDLVADRLLHFTSSLSKIIISLYENIKNILEDRAQRNEIG